ncbi:putative reverse transcriptase domain-containing protein [Tanacetum coccineum]
MESVFNISGFAIENQVKFATYTLLGAALTWWNSQIRTLGPDSYLMTWEVLKKKMTDKYYPQGEVKKLEIEFWNLKKLRTLLRKGKLDNKEQADEFIRNNHVHHNNPSRDRMSANVYNMGRVKRSHTVDLCLCIPCDHISNKYEALINNKEKGDLA